MARKSRYNVLNQTAVKETQVVEKVYKTAMYVRLSNEDLSKNDNGTIENQVLLVQKYVETKPYLNLCKTFVDNGQTGTNFEREGFKNLMEAVKVGKIDCIVVKDLSRFGRNYIETGNYLEKVFPFLGVRFISVNDGYDSHNPAKNGDNLTIILKNLINDIYAKDISRKIKSVYEMKIKNGDYVGGLTPYGYIKSPENKHKLSADKETAPIVRDIFQWKLDGMSSITIARKLNESEVPPPKNYWYNKGILTHSRYSEKLLWSDGYIRRLLSNSVYIGHLAQGKRKSNIDQNLKCELQPKENWITVENTHEPIIEKSVFEAVQKMLDLKNAEYRSRKGKNIGIEKAENIFTGFVCCANCGKNLKRRQQIIRHKIYYNFTCPSYSLTNISNECVRKNISEINLRKVVFTAINHQILLLCDIENEVKRINSSPDAKSKERELLAEHQEITQKINNLTSRKNSLYDDFKDGLLTETEYSYTRKKYKNDNDLMTLRLNEITAELEKHKSEFKKYFLEFKRFGEAGELSRKMLTALIDKIYVYSDNQIEINFKYTDDFEQVIKYIEDSGVNA